MIDMSILISALNQGLEQAINKALAPHIEMIERQNQTIFQLQTEIEAMQKKLDETSINELSLNGNIELLVTDLIESYQPIQTLNDRVDELESQIEHIDAIDDLINSDEFGEAVREVIRNAL